MKNIRSMQHSKTLCGLALTAAIFTSPAQAQIPSLGGLDGGIPVIGDLLGGDLLGGGLLGGDLLGGGIPVLGDILAGGGGLGDMGGMLALDGLMPNIDQTALTHMLDPASLGNPTKYLTAVEGVVAILSSPQTFVPVPLAPPLVNGFVPGFEVLYTAPETLLSFLLGGGSFIDPSLVAFPPVPILSAPLPGELSGLLGDVDVGGGNAAGLMSPQEVVNSVLLLIP